MNTELYFPRSGKAFAETSKKIFEDVVKLLSESDVNIIFKTEINLTKDSVSEALNETLSGDDKIDFIITADALKSSDLEEAQKLLEEIGVTGKLRKITAPALDPNKIMEEKEDSAAVLQLETDESDDDAESEKQEQKETEEKNEEPKTITAFCTEYKNRMMILLPTEEFAGCDFSTILYSVSQSVLKPKQKHKFWKRFIPCSGDSPFDVIRKIILLLAICTFIVSSYMLVNLLVVRPAINDNTTNNIRKLLVAQEEETDENGDPITKKPTDGSEGTLVDFSKLLSENEDTVGWIKVPNTKIDYVVVKPPEGEDHEYYLYRDFYQNYDIYGTVFMDYRSSLDSKNMILHGHHMQDGRMFGTLKYYEDFDFYKKNPTFTFNTIYEKSEWQIISILKTNTLESQGEFFNYLRGDFDSDYDFLNFVYQLRERSIIDTPVKVNENDTLVTLSTCTYDFSEFRFVVVARKVRDGESAKVDVSKARKNPDPLYPDVWYNSFGGTKPEVTSFQDAYNNKKINWYDGKKKDWSEKDDEKLYENINEGREAALEEIQNFIDKNKYADKQQKEIDKLVEKYTELINNANSGSEINKIYDKAIEDIRKVKTLNTVNSEKKAAEQEASEKQLNSKKEGAKIELHNSVAGNTYRKTQATQVNDLFDEYNEKIDNAETVEEVEKLKKEGIKKLAKIKTDDELKKEESEAKEQKAKDEAKKLQTAKKNGISSISNYVNLNNYKDAQRKTINNIISKYKTKINSAKSVDSVNSLVSSAKAEIDKVKTKSQLNAESAAAALEEAKSEGIYEIKNYVALSDYKSAQKSTIKNIISNYTAIINSASSKNEVSKYVKAAKSEMDKVKTSVEIDEESAKAKAKAETEPKPSSEPSEDKADVDESSGEPEE